MRQILFLLSVILFFAGCGSATNSRQESDVIEISISELLAEPFEFDGKNVRIEGVISHVCRHSGDKMRVLQDGSDLTIQVMLGNYTGSFGTESEGERVNLTGLLTAELINIDDLGDDHDCEDDLQAVEALKARGLNPEIRTFISLNHFETK